MYILDKGEHCKHCNELIYEIAPDVWLHQLTDKIRCIAVAEPGEKE